MSSPKNIKTNQEVPDSQSHSDSCSYSQSQQLKNNASIPFESEFQKNYPKNIFIPLIEYLTELGYKQAYEKCVGSRSDFEGKNVVSLSSIYVLISQDWFRRNINKELALTHISNKILLNSKIKKKLFHLLIAHLILTLTFLDVPDFKRKISRQANIIAKRQYVNDQIFSYPNAIIYLLHLFLKILVFHAKKKGVSNKLEEEFSKLSLQEAHPPELKTKSVGSKQEYKFYVKEIVHVFGSKGVSAQNYTDILEEVRQTILQKDKLFRQKYQLMEGIPNWMHFIECVVQRCFEHKKKDAKITNFIFNDWISECKIKMLSNTESKGNEAGEPEAESKVKQSEWMHKNLQFHENWGALPLSLIPPHQELSMPNTEQQKKKEGKAKEFSPIIISKINFK